MGAHLPPGSKQTPRNPIKKPAATKRKNRHPSTDHRYWHILVNVGMVSIPYRARCAGLWERSKSFPSGNSPWNSNRPWTSLMLFVEHVLLKLRNKTATNKHLYYTFTCVSVWRSAKFFGRVSSSNSSVKKDDASTTGNFCTMRFRCFSTISCRQWCNLRTKKGKTVNHIHTDQLKEKIVW